jgi:hypothetical protein
VEQSKLGGSTLSHRFYRMEHSECGSCGHTVYTLAWGPLTLVSLEPIAWAALNKDSLESWQMVEVCVRLRPGIQVAGRAGVFGLAGGLFLGLGTPCPAVMVEHQGVVLGA